MPHAEGTLRGEDADNLTAEFTVEGKKVKFFATAESDVKRFPPMPATLHYDLASDLDGTHTFLGRLGSDKFAFELDNGPRFWGDFESSGFKPAVVTDGTGDWNMDKSTT